MRKRVILSAISIIIMVVYSVLSSLLNTDRNTVFWVGFAFFVFSLLVMGAIVSLSTKKCSAAFPIEISIVAFSLIYVVIVFVINLVFGFIFKIEAKYFVSIHVICLAIFAILTLLMQLTKTGIIKQNNNINRKIHDMQILVCDLEKIKSKLLNMSETSQTAQIARKKSVLLIDSVLDDLRFSDFAADVDITDSDSMIHAKAMLLSSEVDNMIEIQSDNMEAFETSLSEIKQLIQDRNSQIKLLKSGI